MVTDNFSHLLGGHEDAHSSMSEQKEKYTAGRIEHSTIVLHQQEEHA
jgi:hypothetical protein